MDQTIGRRIAGELADDAPDPGGTALVSDLACADLVREIERLAADGRTAAEIGRRLEIPRARVIRIAKRQRIAMGGAGGRRSLLVHMKPAQLAMVDAIAIVADVPRAEMLARLALVFLEQGPPNVIKRLGKLARPKRSYSRRAPRVRPA
jgi:hypothetical protein